MRKFASKALIFYWFFFLEQSVIKINLLPHGISIFLQEKQTSRLKRLRSSTATKILTDGLMVPCFVTAAGIKAVKNNQPMVSVAVSQSAPEGKAVLETSLISFFIHTKTLRCSSGHRYQC